MKRINYIVALIFAATLTLFAQETQPEATGNSLQDILNHYGNSEIIEKAKAGANNLPTAECETPEQEEIVTDHYFTVSADGLKVKFSKGNLRYNIGTDTWSFAPKQYDYVGMSNINLGNPDYKGDIDLFGWSADGKFGVNPSNADADYAGAFVDWGLNMGNHWRTLTSDEWNYLIRTRRVNGQQAYTIASVNGMIGLVVLPDDWQLPTGITLELAYYPDTRVLESNVFTIAQWNQLEQAGAVFLPAVGTRVGGYGNTMNGDSQAAMSNPETGFYSWVSNVSEYGYYWSATPHATTAKSAYQMIWSPYYFNGSRAFPAMWSTEKRRGNAVRLVYDETYESQVKWTVRWVDYADTEVYSTTIDDPEESAEFVGTNPQCYTDAQFDYTFAGWSEAVADEELHTITYKAKYDSTECVYTVVFVWNPDLCKNKRSGYGNELLYGNSETVESYTFKYGEQASLANTVGTESKTIETDQALVTCSFAFDGLTFGDNMKDLIKCGTSDNRYYYVYADITYQVKVKFNISSTSQTTLNSCGEMPVMPTYTDASGTEKKFGIYQDLVNPIYVDGKLFKGWTPAITDVPCYPFESENPVVEYAANLVDVYTIKFIGADGTELESYSQVDVSVDGFAGVKLYEGDDPTKSATEAQTFSFIGWSEPNIDPESLTYTYTAQFNATARKYTITFKNRCTVSDATTANTTTSEYDAKQIDYGQTITAPTDNPTCEGYQFDGWLLDRTENTYLSADDKVTGNATYIATYKPLFTFCFYDEDGTTLLCQTERQYLSNTNPTVVYCLASIPSKPSTAQDTYSFSGWEKIAEDELAHRISYKAVFVSTTNTYTITFKDAAGNNLSSKNIAYGGTIVAPDVNTPEGYDFAGWKVEGSDDVLTTLPTVSGEVTYVAAFTPIVYTVYYLGEGVTDTTQAICSTTVTYQDKENPVSCITDDNKPVKASTAQYDYVLSWSEPVEDADNRTIVYTAEFTEQTRKYTVTFADRTCVEADPTGAPSAESQRVISQSELEYDASITVPADNPTCENHIFLGWKQLLNEETDEVAEDFYTGDATVSGNVTYLAQYTDRVTVRFYADQWSNVKAYQWKWIDGQVDPAEPIGAWGTQEPLPINEEGWYSVSCPISYSILFYTELEDGSIPQTVNIGPITKDTCFELGTKTGGLYEVDNLYQCTHSVYKVLGSENIFDIHISDYDQIGYNYNLDGIPVDDMPNMKRNVREDGNVEYTYMLNNVHLSSSDGNWFANWFAVLKTRYEMNDDTETLEWKCIGLYPNKAYINGPNMPINVSISGTYNIKFSYVVNSTTPSYTLELLEADADVYVVAGDMFDDKWNPTTTDNQMALQDDGTYALSKQLVLESDTYEYKIVKNGSEWFPKSDASGSNNMEMPIEYEGIYNVTFRFNPEAQAISADTAVVSYKVAFKVGDAVLDGCVQTMTPAEIETFCAATDAPCETSVTDYTDADNAYIFIGWEQDYTITRGNLTLKPKYKTVPLGAFSVGTDEEGNARYVWFSKGNLQYQATTGTWRFAENQYDFVGNSNAGTVYDETGMKSNNQNAAADYTGWIDLFALGANGYNDRMPYAYTTTNEITADLTNDEYDWGRNEISGYAAGTWRTLSQAEWEYLLNTRDNAAAKCGKAQIILNSNTTVKCVVFLPDYYNAENITFKSGKTQGFTDNQYDLQSETGMANFNALLQENALIMPVAGMRNGRNLVMTNGNYWTSSVNSTGAMGIAGTFGSSLTIATNNVSLPITPQSTAYGYSVRLVSDSKPTELTGIGGGEEETAEYYLVDDGSFICSTAWTLEEKNKMTLAEDGTYLLTRYGLNSAYGGYNIEQFDVYDANRNSMLGRDGSEGPGDPYVTTGDIYVDFTYIFDPVEKTLNLEIVNYEEKTMAEAVEIANGLSTKVQTEEKYLVTGTVTSVIEDARDTYNNFTLDIQDAEGNTLRCFRTYSNDIVSLPDNLEDLVGATVTVGGRLYRYIADGVYTNEIYYGVVVDIISYVDASSSVLSGFFSINSDGGLVQFSPGNLQYQASTGTWRFAEHQWDFVGDNKVGNVYEDGEKCDNSLIGETYSGWIDLFGWGTSGYNDKYPYMASGSTSDYCKGADIAGTNYDWGVYNQIGSYPAGTWRTLTEEEWTYISSRRPNASKLCGFVRVNGAFGFVLLPDDWVAPEGISFQPDKSTAYASGNNYTVSEWLLMENEGAVFFPAAGSRARYNGSNKISNAGSYGYYWTSSIFDYDDRFPYFMEAYDGWIFSHDYRNRTSDNGLSVRLVR